MSRFKGEMGAELGQTLLREIGLESISLLREWPVNLGP